MKKKWTVYIVRAANGKLYTGVTTDIGRRFSEHRRGKKGAKFFRSSAPEKIVYTEICTGRSKALKREHAIKRLSRAEKLLLIVVNR